MENSFVKACFDHLKALDPKLSFKESEVTEKDMEALQDRFGIEFPEIYKQFISTYAHTLGDLSGTLNNFLFEDDVDVTLTIPKQPYGKELEEIELILESNEKLIEFGYLPIGEFDHYAIMYLDLKDNKIQWIDEEDYYECESREDVAEKGFDIFSNLEELMECFFLKKVHDCI